MQTRTTESDPYTYLRNTIIKMIPSPVTTVVLEGDFWIHMAMHT